jgi:hypothetical protein
MVTVQTPANRIRSSGRTVTATVPNIAAGVPPSPLVPGEPQIWALATLASDVGTQYNWTQASVAVDASNKVHVAYFGGWSNWDLYYATNTSGSWVHTALDTSGSSDTVATGRVNSILIDAAGKVHISYAKQISGSNSGLYYATNASGSWVTSAINLEGSGLDRGQDNRMVIDSAGKLHVVHMDDGPNQMRYSTNASGSWVSENVNPATDVGEHGMDIAVDSTGKVHFAFEQGTVSNKGMAYRSGNSGAWSSVTLIAGHNCGKTAICVDSAGKVHIIFNRIIAPDTFPRLQYATNKSGAWVVQTIYTFTSTPFTHMLDMVIDQWDRLHATWYDNTAGHLKYASNISGAWVVQTPDNTGKVGLRANIAVGGDGVAHIVYHRELGNWGTATGPDRCTADLKHAAGSPA